MEGRFLLWRFMRARRNHLLRAHCRFDADGAHPRVVLEELSYETWKPHRGVRWPHDEVRRMLDDAQSELEERARALRLEVTVIRKERAVGLVAGSTATASQRLTYECLEELALPCRSERWSWGVRSLL